MKVKDFYTVPGLFNADGEYVSNRNYRTIIAECLSDNIDYGYYYFAFLTLQQIADKKTKNFFCFIEIHDLFKFMMKSNIGKIQKLKLDEELVKKYENYIIQLYNARNTIIQEKSPKLSDDYHK